MYTQTIAIQPATVLGWGFVKSMCEAVTKAPMYHKAREAPMELVRSNFRLPARSMKKTRENIVATVLTTAYIPILSQNRSK